MKTLAERISYYASKSKSRAKTPLRQLRAAVAYLLDCSAYWRRSLILDALADTQPGSRYIKMMSDDDRKIRRAKSDRRFRRNWLAQLRRQEVWLLAQPANTIAAYTAWADDDDRINKLNNVGTIYTALGIKRPWIGKVSRIPDGVIYVRPDYEIARHNGYRGSMAGKDATVRPTTRTSCYYHTDGCTRWDRGIPVEYTRARNDNYIRSFAAIRTDDPATIDYVHHNKVVQVTLPTGHWSIDENGLMAVIGPDEYHPIACELLWVNAGASIVAALHTAAETRRRMAAEKAALAAEIDGVYVCVKDGLRAGNCRGGIQSFAARNGLDINKHYPAMDLLNITTPSDLGRVKLAITAAVIQSKKEMTLGFALIEDHRI